MDNAAYTLSKGSISIKLWPPSDNTRKMLVERVTRNLSTKSIFTEKYRCLGKEEALENAHRIEDLAFISANQHYENEPDVDGSSAVQHYAKECSKLILEVLKLGPAAIGVVNERSTAPTAPTASHFSCRALLNLSKMTRSRPDPIHSRFQSRTAPSSPTHHSYSSSSEFEFTISTAATPDALSSGADLCPAGDLFYKGQLLPLHPSPRLKMVKSLIGSSSSSGSSSSASRDSTGSSSSSDAGMFADVNCESSRPSSVAEEDEFISLPSGQNQFSAGQRSAKKYKSFSLRKISSVFKKELRTTAEPIGDSGAAYGSVKKSGASARDVFRKYAKKVIPLYETMSRRQKKHKSAGGELFSDSVSRNLRRDSTMSCPPSIRSSPRHSGALSGQIGTRGSSRSSSFHSGVLSGTRGSSRSPSCHLGVLSGLIGTRGPSRSPLYHSGVLSDSFGTRDSSRSSPYHSGVLSGSISSRDSSTEELQSAIQGAIAHCKNSMMQNKSSPTSTVSSH